jgi:hypothetical protein
MVEEPETKLLEILLTPRVVILRRGMFWLILKVMYIRQK